MAKIVAELRKGDRADPGVVAWPADRHCRERVMSKIFAVLVLSLSGCAGPKPRTVAAPPAPATTTCAALSSGEACLRVVARHTLPPRLSPIRVLVVVDGRKVLDLARGAAMPEGLSGAGTTVFEGPVPAGAHLVQTLILLVGVGPGIEGYLFEVRSTQTVELRAGTANRVDATWYAKDTDDVAAQPSQRWLVREENEHVP